MRLKQIKANQTELWLDKSTVVFFSYDTPVAFHRSGEIPRVTSKKWSTTTTRHINQFLERHGFSKAEKVSQDAIEEMVQS